MSRSCAIIANGYFHGEAMVDQISSLKAELELLSIKVDLVYTDKILTYFSQGEIISAMPEYDFILFLDKDVYISHMLEKSGYKLVNSANAIEICDDKLKTFIKLSSSGVNMPMTISSPLNYAKQIDGLASDVVGILGLPVVVKECFGSMGKTVYLAKTLDELISLRRQLLAKPHLYQQFVGKGGVDIRVIVIGGQAVGAMQRKNDMDFRSNIELGGHGTRVELTDEIKEISERAAKVIGLDYCGVDLLFDGQSYFVCEVNSNAFFKGFTKATGVNVARLYAKYIVDKIYNQD